jgi:TP901 family phage tail tape measure protein
MADKQKTIDIIFGAVDNTGSALSSVGKGLSSLENSVGSVTGPLADITGNILKLDAALGAAAIGLTAYAVNVADKFGTSFAEIATLIGEPAANLGEFKDQLQAYAETSSASFEQITESTYNAISAGVDYKDSLSVIAQAEKLSIAGRADLGITTKALVSTMNAFGAEMSEAEDYSDIFFTTIQKGQTTLPELAESIGSVAPLAAQAGLSFDELGAAIAAITAGAGISTTEAMTALQGAISNIIKPSKEAADLAKKLGIDFGATALESKGLAGVLADVKEATGGNVEQMASLFGSVRALKAVLPLTGTASEKFAEALTAMENKSGKTGAAAKELEDDLSKLGQTLKNNVTSAFIAFGDNLTDESQGIVKAITSMFQGLGAEIKLKDGAFSEIIGQLEGVFKDIENKFNIMAENLPEALDGLDLSAMVGAFDDLGAELGEAFAAIFGDVDLTTVEGLQSAIQTVVDAFTALINITTGIIDGLEPLFDLVNAGVGSFQELSSENKEIIGSFLGLATSVNTVLPILGALGTGLATIGGGMAVLNGAKGLGLLSTNIGGLAKVASVAGKTGFVGAALFGAAGVGVGVGAAINEAVELLSGSSIGSLWYDYRNGDELDLFNEKIEVSAERLREIKAAQEEAGKAQEDRTKFTSLDIDALNDHAAALVKNANQEKNRTENIEDSKAGYEGIEGALKGLVIGYDEATGKANSWSSTLDQNGQALAKNTEKTKDALKETDAYKLKLLDLASDERIANIEANISLNIAQLESDTKTAVAIIETLGTSITSTGNVLSSLFGSFNDASKFDQLAISKQIETENKRRQKSLDEASAMTKAQISLIEQQARALGRGESLINVKADGLAPHLDAIFHEILEAAQVRATQQGLNLLVGLP